MGDERWRRGRRHGGGTAAARRRHGGGTAAARRRGGGSTARRLCSTARRLCSTAARQLGLDLAGLGSARHGRRGGSARRLSTARLGSAPAAHSKQQQAAASSSKQQQAAASSSKQQQAAASSSKQQRAASSSSKQQQAAGRRKHPARGQLQRSSPRAGLQQQQQRSFYHRARQEEKHTNMRFSIAPFVLPAFGLGVSLAWLRACRLKNSSSSL